jgi:hypothetical protein
MVKRKRKRYSGALVAWIAVGVVVAVVLTVVLVKEVSSSSTTTFPNNFPKTSSAVFHDVTHVSEAALNQVAINSGGISVAPVTTLSGPSFKIDGLPGVFYYGANYCPYCAATRWGLIVALSRLGTLNQLYNMWSSPTDQAGPNVPTFTLEHTTYTSKYLGFQGFEVLDRHGNPNMTLPSNLQGYVNAYNAQQSFPFIDFNNKVQLNTSSFDPQILVGIKTQAAIAKNLNDPTNPVTQVILASANYLTAGLCSIAKDPPTSVCGAPGVQAAASAAGIKL